MKREMNKIYSEINHDIFNGQLERPKFVFIYNPDIIAWYIAENLNGIDYDIMNLNPVEMDDYITIFGAIAHEMIHQFQYRLTDKKWSQCNHAKDFRDIASEIEKFYNLPKDSV